MSFECYGRQMDLETTLFGLLSYYDTGDDKRRCFWPQFDIIWTLWTLDGRWNNVAYWRYCLLTLFCFCWKLIFYCLKWFKNKTLFWLNLEVISTLFWRLMDVKIMLYDSWMEILSYFSYNSTIGTRRCFDVGLSTSASGLIFSRFFENLTIALKKFSLPPILGHRPY